MPTNSIAWQQLSLVFYPRNRWKTDKQQPWNSHNIRFHCIIKYIHLKKMTKSSNLWSHWYIQYWSIDIKDWFYNWFYNWVKQKAHEAFVLERFHCISTWRKLLKPPKNSDIKDRPTPESNGSHVSLHSTVEQQVGGVHVVLAARGFNLADGTTSGHTTPPQIRRRILCVLAGSCSCLDTMKQNL